MWAPDLKPGSPLRLAVVLMTAPVSWRAAPRAVPQLSHSKEHAAVVGADVGGGLGEGLGFSVWYCLALVTSTGEPGATQAEHRQLRSNKKERWWGRMKVKSNLIREGGEAASIF